MSEMKIINDNVELSMYLCHLYDAKQCMYDTLHHLQYCSASHRLGDTYLSDQTMRVTDEMRRQIEVMSFAVNDMIRSVEDVYGIKEENNGNQD